jgi:hypothetical protein
MADDIVDVDVFVRDIPRLVDLCRRIVRRRPQPHKETGVNQIALIRETYLINLPAWTVLAECGGDSTGSLASGLWQPCMHVVFHATLLIAGMRVLGLLFAVYFPQVTRYNSLSYFYTLSHS